jgi:hypothetical protein
MVLDLGIHLDERIVDVRIAIAFLIHKLIVDEAARVVVRRKLLYFYAAEK